MTSLVSRSPRRRRTAASQRARCGQSPPLSPAPGRADGCEAAYQAPRQLKVAGGLLQTSLSRGVILKLITSRESQLATVRSFCSLSAEKLKPAMLTRSNQGCNAVHQEGSSSVYSATGASMAYVCTARMA